MILTVIFLAAAVTYVWANIDEFRALHWPSPFAIVLVAAAYVVNVALVSFYNYLSSRRLGANLTPTESFMLSSVAAAGNFVLPVKAGAGLRALYMKKVHSFPISFFTSSTLIYMLASVFVVSIIAVAILVAINSAQGYLRFDLTIIFPAIMIISIASLLLFKVNGKDQSGKDESWIGSFKSSLLALLGEKGLVSAALLIVALVYLVASVVWTVALRDIAPEITVLEAFLLAASQIISGFITLTPGAAGFQEIAALYVGKSFSATTTEIFAVLIWVRVVRVATSILVAIPSMWILRERMNSEISQ